jgi:gas vesicle protein
MNGKGGGFIVGFAIGALAGAAAALLLAPESGEELRKDISDKTIELKDQAQQLAVDTKVKTQQQVDALQEQGRIVLSENVKKAQQVVQDAQVKLNKLAVTEEPADAAA